MVQVLAQADAAQQGFDPSIFINPAHLHLTLLMLKLYSDEARHKAAQALQCMQAQVGRGSMGRTSAWPCRLWRLWRLQRPRPCRLWRL